VVVGHGLYFVNTPFMAHTGWRPLATGTVLLALYIASAFILDFKPLLRRRGLME